MWLGIHKGRTTQNRIDIRITYTAQRPNLPQNIPFITNRSPFWPSQYNMEKAYHSSSSLTSNSCNNLSLSCTICVHNYVCWSYLGKVCTHKWIGSYVWGRILKEIQRVLCISNLWNGKNCNMRYREMVTKWDSTADG